MGRREACQSPRAGNGAGPEASIQVLWRGMGVERLARAKPGNFEFQGGKGFHLPVSHMVSGGLPEVERPLQQSPSLGQLVDFSMQASQRPQVGSEELPIDAWIPMVGLDPRSLRLPWLQEPTAVTSPLLRVSANGLYQLRKLPSVSLAQLHPVAAPDECEPLFARFEDPRSPVEELGKEEVDIAASRSALVIVNANPTD